MKRVHFYLIKNQGWYAKWHQTPYSTLVHYAIFLVFIVFVGMNIVSSVKAPSFSLTAQAVKPFDDLNFKDRMNGKKELGGEEAINALGGDISRVASYYGRTRQELEFALRNSKDLKLNKDALLFYSDTELIPQNITPGDGILSNNPAISDIPDSQTFFLHSKPNATAKIHLDFDGAITTNTSWNYIPEIISAPFSVDTDPAFNTDELNRIKSIWRSVSEDYAQFNVDVTTEQPVNNDMYHYAKLIISPTWEWFGQSGGVALLGSFRSGNGTPAFVFSGLLGNNVKYISEAATHEVGHTLGLYHTSTYDSACIKLNDYNYGSGTNPYGWAPIMGVGYYKTVTQFTNTSEHPLLASPYGCTSEQDDIGIMTSSSNGDLRFTNDEAGNTINSASILRKIVVGNIANVDHLGILSKNDIDVYKIQTIGGNVSLNVNPMTPVVNGYITGNADFSVRLLDSAGNTLFSSNPANIASATIEVSGVPTGTYYLEIAPSGYLTVTDPGGYTTTGSAGQYNVVGTYASAPDLSPIVTISSPVDGSTITAGSVTISSSSVAQAGTRINKMEIIVDNRIVKTSSRSPISYKWSMRRVSAGEHTILVKAYDNQGNISEKSITVYR